MVTAGCFLNTSCEEEELNIQDNFPFEVSVMPLPDEIADGQAVELRFTIQPTGNYSNTRYFIRYFQFEGQGNLQYFDDPPYLPNDLYELPELQFRLYYTAASAVSQSFDVWISDNFGNERQVSFQFNSSD
jgi:hypothetical protein